MEVEIKIKKLGASYFLIVPKYLIDTFQLLYKNAIYDVNIENDGDTIIYRRKDKQTKLSKFLKGGK